MMNAYDLPTIDSKLAMIDTIISRHKDALLVLDTLRVALIVEQSIQSNKVAHGDGSIIWEDKAADKESYDNERQMGEHI
tara:strand:+ start:355 stop:591 length:237 start_codon:yes stop_codon:yes gene_type:complete